MRSESAPAAAMAMPVTNPRSWLRTLVIALTAFLTLVDLFAMVRAVDLPEAMRNATWVEPPLVIRQAAGPVHPEYAAVKLAFGFPP